MSDAAFLFMDNNMKCSFFVIYLSYFFKVGFTLKAEPNAGLELTDREIVTWLKSDA